MNSSSKCRPHCGRPYGVEFSAATKVQASRLLILSDNLPDMRPLANSLCKGGVSGCAWQPARARGLCHNAEGEGASVALRAGHQAEERHGQSWRFARQRHSRAGTRGTGRMCARTHI